MLKMRWKESKLVVAIALLSLGFGISHMISGDSAFWAGLEMFVGSFLLTGTFMLTMMKLEVQKWEELAAERGRIDQAWRLWSVLVVNSIS